jgi:hypothetical protein
MKISSITLKIFGKRAIHKCSSVDLFDENQAETQFSANLLEAPT